MIANDARYRIVSAEDCGRGLSVSWGDGHQSRFHAIWLRHQCTCPSCGTPVNAVRGIRLHHIPDEIAVADFDVGNGEIAVTWSDGHRSDYDALWLRDHCYSSAERMQRRHRPILWDGSIMDALPEVDFAVVSTVPAARLEMLKTICDYGFCKVRNAPAEVEAAHQLIELVGPQRQSHYGTYALSKKKSVDNVGDTTGPLDPHTDETYRLSTIGITVFQVIRPASSGGDSTLVDGFEAARRLRSASPEAFDLLTQLPITTERLDQAANSQGQRRWYRARMPFLRVDESGELVGVRLNERQIGPLDLPEEFIEPCYQALREIFGILYDPELRITLPLKAGEGLLFNNQRLLHGRTGYQVESPGRSVLTSSVDMEDFFSSMRMLEVAVNGRESPTRYALGMVS